MNFFPDTTSFLDNIRQNYSKLSNFLISVSDLAAWLFENDCMSKTQHEKFLKYQTNYEAAEKLLNFLIKQESENIYNLFLIGLLQTNQPHIYKLLTVQGWYLCRP